MALVIRLLGGLTLWGLGFSLLYALHGYGCAAGWGRQPVAGPVTMLGGALIASWLLLIGMAAALALWQQRDRKADEDRLLCRVGLVGAWAGLAGIILLGAPVVLPARCW